MARPFAEAEIDTDLDLVTLEVRGNGRLIIPLACQAAARDLRVAEPDRKQVTLRRLARLAHRHDDPSPIGILAGNCGFHQRRIGDRQRDTVRAAVALRAGHLDLDEFGRAFTIADHQMGQLQA